MLSIIFLMFAVRIVGHTTRKSLAKNDSVKSMRRSYSAWEKSRKVRYY
jgi:hypothetical protein